MRLMILPCLLCLPWLSVGLIRADEDSAAARKVLDRGIAALGGRAAFIASGAQAPKPDRSDGRVQVCRLP